MVNEEDHIEAVVRGFLNSDYVPLVEILIADGGSTDATRDIVSRLSKEDSRVILIDNPQRYQSYALNTMIERARGELFLRADGHCIYQQDYLTSSVDALLKTDARNVGGAQRYKAQNRVQAGTALAVESLLGNGGAHYMKEHYEGFADTVFLGCYRTEDLKAIGGFSTAHITNQDSELNLRLIEIFGPCVYLSPRIKSWYLPRSSYQSLFKQYFRYGRGRFLTLMQHPGSMQKRGLSPFLFLLLTLGYGLAELFSPSSLYFSEFVTLLIGVVLLETLRNTIARRQKVRQEIWSGKGKAPRLFWLWAGSLTSILTMLSAHFMGFSYQIIRKFVVRVKGW